MEDNNNKGCLKCWFMNQWENIKKKFEKETKFVTASYAYEMTTYGCAKTKEQKIKDHRKSINNLIESKLWQKSKSDTTFNSYFCVYDINNDDAVFVNEIFEPFKDNGFNIICLSDRLEELKDSHVYLIEWQKRK